jgi:hypothetical protein
MRYAREIWKVGHTELKTGGYAGGVSDIITGNARLCSRARLSPRFFHGRHHRNMVRAILVYVLS